MKNVGKKEKEGERGGRNGKWRVREKGGEKRGAEDGRGRENKLLCRSEKGVLDDYFVVKIKISQKLS